MDARLVPCCKALGAARFSLRVRVKPNAGRSRVLGVNPERGALEIALNAPPRDGAANEELRRLLKSLLGIPLGSVCLAAGAKSREKLVELDCSAECLPRLLGGG